jgi:UDP-glucuronate decarboxylase
LPSDDPTQRCPDIELAKKHLGWQPVMSLEAGLAKTIDYFKQLLKK